MNGKMSGSVGRRATYVLRACVHLCCSECLKSSRTLNRRRQSDFFTTLTTWAYSVSAQLPLVYVCVGGVDVGVGVGVDVWV